MTILVVDVSQYQGPNLDGEAFKRAGVRGAWIEAIRGNDGPNPYFAQQAAAFDDAGIPWGPYMLDYPIPNLAPHVNRDPVGQVGLFYDAVMSATGTLGALPPMSDCEWPEPSAWKEWGCTAESIGAWLDAGAIEVDRRFARSTIIYCDPDYAHEVDFAANSPSFVSRRLWAAAYPKGSAVVISPPTGNAPKIPPWSSATLWQFTDHFAIAGFGTTDASIFLGDEDAWTAFVNG